MVSINGKIPGDTIVVPLGAEVEMNFMNRLGTRSLSVHVHGLDKMGLWYTDGVAFVQQCPICPNSEFVNAGIAAVLLVWLEGHFLTIVAADGVDIKPIQVDALVIFPGERYDILVKGLTTPTQKNYRFIFETLERFDYAFQPVDNKSVGLANLQYEDPTLPDTDIGNILLTITY
uniref:Plastocyanin-like domain-containing protein n=1 Tax=Acrobeloides nanus TaxID=290746 RepID=A0A914BUF0_9BILA